jgi:hypothetical protein
MLQEVRSLNLFSNNYWTSKEQNIRIFSFIFNILYIYDFLLPLDLFIYLFIFYVQVKFPALGARSSLDFQNILEKHPVILRILEGKITFHHLSLQSLMFHLLPTNSLRYATVK